MIINWTWTHDYIVYLSKQHSFAYIDFIGTLEYDIWEAMWLFK